MRTDEPTREIRAAWACKELLRQVPAAHNTSSPSAPPRICPRRPGWRAWLCQGQPAQVGPANADTATGTIESLQTCSSNFPTSSTPLRGVALEGWVPSRVAISDLHHLLEGIRDRMLTQENDVDGHGLNRQGCTVSALARHLGYDRKTIRVYLSSGRIAGQRVPAASSADPLELIVDYLRQRLVDDPHLWAVVLPARFDAITPAPTRSASPTPVASRASCPPPTASTRLKQLPKAHRVAYRGPAGRANYPRSRSTSSSPLKCEEPHKVTCPTNRIPGTPAMKSR